MSRYYTGPNDIKRMLHNISEEIGRDDVYFVCEFRPNRYNDYDTDLYVAAALL